MAETTAPPKRWIIVKFFQHAVERAEHEIEELRSQGLYVRDASGPDDRHVPQAPAPSGAAPTTTPPGTVPGGAKPDDKEKP